MQPRERLRYSPITKRAPLRFPAGVRLVVWPVLAREEWDTSRPMARMVISPPQGQPQLPDLPNWSWHEYGMRVGFWRLEKMLRQVGAAPTVTLNARVCETYPEVVEACIANGWELNAHGYDQVPMHKLDDQRTVIMKSMEVISKFWGKRPTSSSADRPAISAKAGLTATNAPSGPIKDTPAAAFSNIPRKSSSLLRRAPSDRLRPVT